MKIIAENDLAFAVFDIFPVTKGHTLIITKEHRKDFFAATKEEKGAILDLIDEVKSIVDDKYAPIAYNIGMNCGKAAGQEIMHLHVHLIPRYENDTKKPRGGVRGVISKK
jgi:diadenosine tetraphosphate (Ap4A) HIT family hydrolase